MTTRAYRLFTRQSVRVIRAFLLVFAAEYFYAIASFALGAHRETEVLLGMLGALWGLFVLGSEWAFLPAIVRVRLRQITQAWLIVSLSIIGFYGLDLFRALGHPNAWNIPVQIHLPELTSDPLQSIAVLLISFLMTVFYCIISFFGLVMGFSTGVLADSSDATSKLRQLGLNAWHSLLSELQRLTGKLRQGGPLDGVRTHLHQFNTRDIREFKRALTHWPGTSERDWAMTVALWFAYGLAGYLAILGIVSLIMIVALLVVGIVGLILYLIIKIVEFVFTLIKWIVALIVIIIILGGANKK